MNRLTVLQKIINQTNANNYLEIGVCEGDIISRLQCPNKIGVDPSFQLRLVNQVRRFIPSSSYKTFECTSDDFFIKYAESELKNGLDVAFVDGLHTYDQTLKDIENCLKYLNPTGFIVVHDCNPLNSAGGYPVKNSIDEVLEAASKGEVPGWNGCWNGDVWKALVYLRSERNDLNIFTLDLDWGLGIISYGKPIEEINYTAQAIDEMDFEFFDKNRNKLIQLKEPKFLDSFLSKV